MRPAWQITLLIVVAIVLAIIIFRIRSKADSDEAAAFAKDLELQETLGQAPDLLAH